MRRSTSLLLCTLFIILMALPAWGLDFPERRREQWATEPGHMIIPAPYSLDGIGDGVALFGMSYNIYNTTTDVLGSIITGDLEGYGAGFTELHLIDKLLFMDFTVQSLKKAMIESYSGRGMNTPKDDYIVVGLDDMLFTGGRLTLTFKDRMFELYAMGYDGSYKIDRLIDKDGNELLSTINGEKSQFNLYGVGLVLDLTDDKRDPKRGIRLDSNIAWSPNKSDFNADYRVLDHSLTGYIPLGKRSTWAFNYFQSDADVSRQGETNPAAIAAELGFDCSAIIDPIEQAECQTAADEYVANTVAANTYGTASSLGGRSRLRSYPDDRFSGAHTAFIGTEFRWNLTEESRPFDIKLVKDIRTGIQVAFFYEIGTVSETWGGLWNETRDSIGVGFRMVNASGAVYRADIATGDEGPSFTLIINYPWEAF